MSTPIDSTKTSLVKTSIDVNAIRVGFKDFERAERKRKAERLIAKEQQVRADANALFRCGLRPKVVRMIMGNDISLTECNYLFAIQTPLQMAARHGRLKFNATTERTDTKSKASSFRKLSSANSEFCIGAIKLIDTAVLMGATHGDAVASTWRIATGARGLEEHESIGGICCEDLAVIWRNIIADQVHVLTCRTCKGSYIDTIDFFNKCPGCANLSKRVMRRNIA